MHLEWEETATDDALTNQPLAAPSFSIKGSIDVTSAHEHPKSCTGTLSTRPGPYGNVPAGFLSGGLVSISAVLPNDGKYVQSSGTEACGLAPNAGLGVGGPGVPAPPEAVAAGAPTASFPESQPSYKRVFSVPTVTHREPAPNGIEESESSFSLSATLTAVTSVLSGPQGSGGGGVSPGGGHSHSSPPPLRRGKKLDAAKQQARRDLPEALRDAWAAHGLLSVIGLAGAPFVSIADELGQSAAPLAGNDATTRVLDDIRIYDDPPLLDFEVLARGVPLRLPSLPPCRPGSASLLSYCSSLRHAWARLLAADGAVAGDDTALERTVSRASAAAAARNAPALARQERQLPGLESALARAFAAKRRAAPTVRALLRRADPGWALSAAQAASAIAWLKERLARAGLGSAKLPAGAAAALTPVPTDPLTSL